jgi:hypothetical protein
MMEQIGRLAVRVTGDTLTVYYAEPETMEAALVIGSISLAAVRQQNRKREFIDLMEAVVGDIIEEATGIRPTWGRPVAA